MKISSDTEKRRSVIIGIIVFLALLLFLYFLQANSPNPETKNLTLGALGSLLASAFFLIVPEYVLKNDDIPIMNDSVNKLKASIEELKGDTKKTNALTAASDNLGVKNVLSIKTEDTKNDSVWLDLLHNSKNELCIITRTANSWFKPQFRKEFAECLIRLANSGGKVKIVILSPDNLKGININSTDEKPYRSKIEFAIQEIRKIVESQDLKKENACNIELRQNDTVSFPYSYIRNDSDTLVSPYLFTEQERSQFITVFDNDKFIAQGFYEDFNLMFTKSQPIDIAPKPFEITTYKGQPNVYHSRSWDREETTRYVIKKDNIVTEAGFYIHYNKEELVEKIIELSTSFGCTYKCKYCASSMRRETEVLDDSFILEILLYLCKINGISKQDDFVLTMTGIGDYSKTYKVTNRFIIKAHSLFPNFRVILSSCAWNEFLIRKAEDLLYYDINILYLQWTYISSERNRARKMITNLPKKYDMDWSSIIEKTIGRNDKMQGVFKINYLMIKDVNDSDADFDAFISFVNSIKDKIIVRISKLNETLSSRTNDLLPPTNDRLQELQRRCKANNIEAYVFWSEINDHMNCGQLIAPYISEEEENKSAIQTNYSHI